MSAESNVTDAVNLCERKVHYDTEIDLFISCDSQTQTDTPNVVKYDGNYLQQLLTSLNSTITFLRSELNEKNIIIKKLLEGVNVCTSTRLQTTADISSSLNMETTSPNNIKSNNVTADMLPH